jgi:hypothetical protein
MFFSPSVRSVAIDRILVTFGRDKSIQNNQQKMHTAEGRNSTGYLSPFAKYAQRFLLSSPHHLTNES